MKHLPLFLLLLLGFRICVVPIGYARYANELAHSNVSYEQIRVKNRRSSYLEDGGHISEILSPASSVFVTIRRFLFKTKKRVVSPLTGTIPPFKYSLLLPVMPRCLYLLNRAFRI